MNKLPDIFLDRASIICDYAKILWQKSYVEGNGGNISMKVTKNTFLCTPTLFSKRAIEAKDIILVDAYGEHLFGIHKPSSEISTHMAIYRSNPKAKAIIHTHPPYTCSYAFSDSLPSIPFSPESALWMDELFMVPYLAPGSEELAKEVEYSSQGRNNVVLQNHGLFTWDVNMERAFWRTEVIENHCKVANIIESRGAKPKFFTESEYSDLSKLKRELSDGE